MAGRITVSTLNDDTGVLATQNGMTGISKAWVNFNGTSTTTIRNSFNVSSITKNSTGNYRINLTTAMPNENYAIFGALSSGLSGVSAINHNIAIDTSTTAPTTSAFIIQTGLNYFTASEVLDEPYVYVSVLSL
jgi:hypothetical protein